MAMLAASLTCRRGLLRIGYVLSLASLVRQTPGVRAYHQWLNQCPAKSIPSASLLERSSTLCTTTTSSSGGSGVNQQLANSEIDTTELALILQNEDVLLIDVREEWEVAEMGKISANAINIPLGEIQEVLEESPEVFNQKYQTPLAAKNRDIIFYCMAGIRSLDALEVAQDLGYTNVRHYIRGWLGWQTYLDNLKTVQ